MAIPEFNHVEYQYLLELLLFALLLDNVELVFFGHRDLGELLGQQLLQFARLHFLEFFFVFIINIIPQRYNASRQYRRL